MFRNVLSGALAGSALVIAGTAIAAAPPTSGGAKVSTPPKITAPDATMKAGATAGAKVTTPDARMHATTRTGTNARVNTQSPLHASTKATTRAGTRSAVHATSRTRTHATAQVRTRATAHAAATANSQSLMHASLNAIAHASSNSVLARAAVDASALPGLGTGLTVKGSGGATIGTISRVVTGPDGKIRLVVATSPSGRTIRLAPNELSISGGVVTRTMP